MKTRTCCLTLLLGLCLTQHATAQQPKPAKPRLVLKKKVLAVKKIDRAALEKKFQEQMTNVSLVGHFTDSNHPSDKLTEERYTIEKVTKDKGDFWIFSVRIQYGDRDVKIPLRLPVKWAGDTPVISVTNFGIPLIGTYSARVVIYQGQYAGTWAGKTHGGHLFGKIVKNDAAAKKDDPK